MGAWNPKANGIFLDAVEIDAGRDRDAFLAEACRNDAELRAAVESLLAANQRAGSFMNHGAPGIAATIDTPAAPPVGTEIGPYKLREQIGEGGFGVVYVAEQTEPVSRKVALKIIKPGMDTKEVIARFEAERQALALMDHPNVAKVLDAGAAQSGRPYFVMELVRGVPITHFCDEQKLATRERLELFVDVCRAVQHAHQKGIIHRDLKPSNVMVTLHDDKPIPKVIDFGVSKALASKLTEKTVYTAYGQIVGTPLYMSPEQAQLSGLDVDTRSDVYALGVLLYELLTGQTPFDKGRLRSAAFEELLRILREEEPPRPSMRISTLKAESLSTVSDNRKIHPRKFSQSLRGELDWIVMTALEKDRTRRYESASAFAADVERYLAGELVQARPASAWYRLGKFARRRKSALIAAAAVMLFVFTIAGSLGWIVRDREARQTRLAGQVELILEDVDRLMEHQRWPEALATAKRAEAALESGDPGATTQDRVQQVLADLTFVQRLEDARLLLSQAGEGTFNRAGAERAYADAFTSAGLTVEGLTVEQAAARVRAREAIAIELATGLTDWARLRKVTTTGTQDTSWKHLLAVADAVDPDRWRRRLRATWKTKGGANTLRELADSADVRRLPPSTVVLLGQLLRSRVSPQAGAKLLLKAQQDRPGDFWINFELAICFSESKPKQLDEAVVFYHAALALRPTNAAVHHNLGNVLQTQGKLDEAIACYKRAIELDPKAAVARSNLGVILLEQGKVDEAVGCCRKAIELDPKSASAHLNLGNALRAQQELDEAVACYRKAIELDPKDATAHNNLGVGLMEQQKLDEAVACIRTAIELDPKVAMAHNNLGNALRAQQELDEAVACYRTAIELDPKYATAHANLGEALTAQGKLVEAIDCIRTAIELDPKSAPAHAKLGDALRAQGKLDEAIACYRKAIELDPKLAPAHANLGGALTAQGKLDEAIACYRKAIELGPKNVKLLHNDLGVALAKHNELDGAVASIRKAIELDANLANAHHNLGNVLKAQGKLDEAIACYRKAIELDPNLANAHRGLASALWSQGKLDAVVSCWRKVIELEPKVAGNYSNLGAVLHKQGKLDEAVISFRKAIELDPKAGYYYNLGLALVASGKRDEAVAPYRKAIALNPKYAWAYVKLGDVLSHQGKPVEAEALYRKAMELNPNEAWFHWCLASFLTTVEDVKLRKPKEALEAARKAVELGPETGKFQSKLGVALYRNDQFDAAVETLEKARAMRGGEDPQHRFFLAMAYWKAGREQDALAEYSLAVSWLEESEREPKQYRFRDEAEALIGSDRIRDAQKPTTQPQEVPE